MFEYSREYLLFMIELFTQLDSLNMPKSDYAITGSGPLFAHGLISSLDNDLDVVARNDAWKIALTFGNPKSGDLGDLIIDIFDGRIQIFNRWSFVDESTDEIIDNAETHNGHPFATIDHVLAFKKKLKREKDLHHIKLIEDFQKAHEHIAPEHVNT